MRFAIALAVLVLLPSAALAQATWYVPDDFGTIQEAISAASNGDTIIVRPDSVHGGPYCENITFGPTLKAVTLRSEFGPAVTTIDGGQFTGVVVFDKGEGADTVLEGFTITNGSAVQGGGIYCSYSSPTITNCTVSGNTASYQGGGIYCSYSSPTIMNCTVSGNTAEEGGGIWCNNSSPTITNNTISGNTAKYGGGIYCYKYSYLTITNNVLSGNTANQNGGGVYYHSSSPTMTFNTISGNMANQDGGGIYCLSSSYPTITNTILWDNSSNEISGGSPTVTYSCIKGGWPGTGNHNLDPLFADPVNGDYFLMPGSPCIDAGDPVSPPDCDGSIADMGAIPAIPPDDCNDNQIPDVCDLYAGTSLDCNFNDVPDECDIASGFSKDCNQNGVPDECEGGVTSYCTAKLNSLGCTPTIDASGGCPAGPSLTGPDDFHVTASDVLNNKYGIMIWSHGPNSLPFMGGILCLAPPIIRTPVQVSGGNPPPPDCSGSYSYHFSQAYMSSWLLTPGTKLYAQYWSRDPGFAPPNNVGLTDGLEFVVGP